jgi:hypothetical protein
MTHCILQLQILSYDERLIIKATYLRQLQLSRKPTQAEGRLAEEGHREDRLAASIFLSLKVRARFQNKNILSIIMGMVQLHYPQ